MNDDEWETLNFTGKGYHSTVQLPPGVQESIYHMHTKVLLFYNFYNVQICNQYQLTDCEFGNLLEKDPERFYEYMYDTTTVFDGESLWEKMWKILNVLVL